MFLKNHDNDIAEPKYIMINSYIYEDLMRRFSREISKWEDNVKGER